MRYTDSLLLSTYTQALLSARADGFWGESAQRAAYRTAVRVVYRLTGERVDPEAFVRLITASVDDADDLVPAAVQRQPAPDRAKRGRTRWRMA